VEVRVPSLILALSIMLGAQVTQPIHLPKLDPPTKDAPAPTDAEMATLKAGVALFQQKRYDEAIAKYQEVVAANPDAVGAIYEIALAYGAKGDRTKAIDVALPTLQYRSPDLDKYYALVGSMLDELNAPNDAVTVYEAGLAALPKSGTLYFNKAVTELQSLKDPAAALITLKRGAVADPAHAGVQFLLGRLFLADDFRSPALLALSRVLMVEQGTTRTVEVYKVWYALLQQNASKGANGQMELHVNPGKKTTEGQLLQLDLQIALSQTATATENQTFGERLVAQWNGLLGVWSKYTAGDDADKMLWTYYMPYFMEMRAQKLVEPFVYYVSQNVNAPGIREWIASHQDSIQALVAWNKAYVWPTAR
jgi:tetratricopeptide (TPR) repeat protein